MKNPRIRQIATLLYLHAQLVPEGSGKRNSSCDVLAFAEATVRDVRARARKRPNLLLPGFSGEADWQLVRISHNGIRKNPRVLQGGVAQAVPPSFFKLVSPHERADSISI